MINELIAQQDLLMYNLNEIPQSAYNNPSNKFNGSFYIGIPAISSDYLSFSNSGFSYAQAFNKQGDSLVLDYENLISKLGDQNFISFNTKIDLFSFGISLSDRTQLNFNITENANMRFNFLKEYIEFIAYGNGSIEGSNLNLENFAFSVNHYREYAIGVSHQLKDKLRIGGRLKYLYGMENINISKTDILITTDPITFDLAIKSDLLIQTSGIDIDSDVTETSSEYLFGRNNRGMGIDLGANYDLNDKFSFNASIIDLGFINWNSYTTVYENKTKSFEFNGVDVDDFIIGSEDGSDASDEVLDSLEGLADFDTLYQAYRTNLTSRVYLGGSYQINERSMANLLIQAEIFNGLIKPSFTLAYQRKMNEWINLTSSYTIINRSYGNLGLGASFNPGPVQFYVVTDNLLGTISPQHARHLQLRFGINLIFGAQKSKNLDAAYNRTSMSEYKSRKDSEKREIEQEVIEKDN